MHMQMHIHTFVDKIRDKSFLLHPFFIAQNFLTMSCLFSYFSAGCFKGTDGRGSAELCWIVDGRTPHHEPIRGTNRRQGWTCFLGYMFVVFTPRITTGAFWEEETSGFWILIRVRWPRQCHGPLNEPFKGPFLQIGGRDTCWVCLKTGYIQNMLHFEEKWWSTIQFWTNLHMRRCCYCCCFCCCCCCCCCFLLVGVDLHDFVWVLWPRAFPAISKDKIRTDLWCIFRGYIFMEISKSFQIRHKWYSFS